MRLPPRAPRLVSPAWHPHCRRPGAPWLSVGLAPFAGAATICPDTGYAALSPMTRGQKISLALGAYAGFKLLFPAGPLMVATSLGVAGSQLYCVLVFLPVWAAGLAYGRVIEPAPMRSGVRCLNAEKCCSGLVSPAETGQPYLGRLPIIGEATLQHAPQHRIAVDEMVFAGGRGVHSG